MSNVINSNTKICTTKVRRKEIKILIKRKHRNLIKLDQKILMKRIFFCSKIRWKNDVLLKNIINLKKKELHLMYLKQSTS